MINDLLSGRTRYLLLVLFGLLPSIAAFADDIDNDGIDASVDPNDLVPHYHVSAGDRHTCSLSDEGVLCWGFNFYDRTETPSLTNPTQISAGLNHTCALDDTGPLCWGLDNYDQSTPPALSSPRIISAGGDFSCALDDAGVTCWGKNDYLQKDVPALQNPVTVTTGRNHACSLDDTGVVCWGDDSANQKTVPTLSGTIIDVKAGNNSTCALTTTGVTCWGDITSIEGTPSLANPRQISTGKSHACAIDDTGVVCWGDDTYGQKSSPSLSNPYLVSAGGSHTCALDDIGVQCWGNNDDGAANTPSLIAPQVVSVFDDTACAIDDGAVKCWGRNGGFLGMPSLTNPVEIAVGAIHACAQDDNGISCWGTSSYGLDTVPSLQNPSSLDVGRNIACATHDNGVTCWGQDSSNRIGDTPSLSGTIRASVSQEHVCATDGSTPACWGADGYGQSSPTVSSDVTDIVAGGTHSCAISSGAVTCWGDSSYIKLLVPTLTNPVRLYANMGYTCAEHDGGLKCWGDVRYGERDVALNNPTSISVDYRNACVVDDDGLRCWGQNDYSTSSIPYFRNFSDHDGDGVTDDADGFPFDPTRSAANQPPSASLPANYEAIQNISFTVDGSSSIDPDGTLTAWNWDQDDADGVDFASPDASGDAPDLIYDVPGIYTLTLSVTDNGGATDTATSEVIVLADTDGDSVPDNSDDFPNVAAASNDGDGDSFPDDCTSDQDCLDVGLTPDPSLDDYDNDGIPTSEDSDDTTDTSPPNVIAPEDIGLVATGTDTEVDLLQNSMPYAEDFPDVALSATPDTESNASLVMLPSGRHSINWCATDSAGNQGCDTQTVDITPLALFSAAIQTTAEGVDVEVEVRLSGDAVTYPVTIPIDFDDINSTAIYLEDHNAVSNAIVIEFDAAEPNKGTYVFSTVDDGITGEMDETVILKLLESNTSGDLEGASLGDEVTQVHTITITETNVAPSVSIEAPSSVSLSSSLASYSIIIDDPNNHDEYLVSWFLDGELIASGTNQTELNHDISGVSAGSHILRVTVLDSGAPAMQGESEQEIRFTQPSSESSSGGGGAPTLLIMASLALACRRRRR